MDEVLGHLSKLMIANTKTMCVIASRAMVLGKFFDAALPYLTAAQCGEVGRSFRLGIDDAMSLMDDVALPAEYHSALLELTNTTYSL